MNKCFVNRETNMKNMIYVTFLSLILISAQFAIIELQDVEHHIISNQNVLPNIQAYALLLSPLKQFHAGIAVQDIKCEQDLIIIVKSEDGSPACVKLQTAPVLKMRGWANEISNTIKEQKTSFIGTYAGLEQLTGSVIIQSKTFFMTTFNGTLGKSGYVDIPFHGVVFTLFPQPTPMEVTGDVFYANTKFQNDQINEVLYLMVPSFTDLRNLTTTTLSYHTNPQGGIVSYDGQIKLLVSADNKTTIK